MAHYFNWQSTRWQTESLMSVAKARSWQFDCGLIPWLNYLFRKLKTPRELDLSVNSCWRGIPRIKSVRNPFKRGNYTSEIFFLWTSPREGLSSLTTLQLSLRRILIALLTTLVRLGFNYWYSNNQGSRIVKYVLWFQFFVFGLNRLMVVFFILLFPFILHMALTRKTTKKRRRTTIIIIRC